LVSFVFGVKKRAWSDFEIFEIKKGEVARAALLRSEET
jgi:hypothetical protein